MASAAAAKASADAEDRRPPDAVSAAARRWPAMATGPAALTASAAAAIAAAEERRSCTPLCARRPLSRKHTALTSPHQPTLESACARAGTAATAAITASPGPRELRPASARIRGVCVRTGSASRRHAHGLARPRPTRSRRRAPPPMSATSTRTTLRWARGGAAHGGPRRLARGPPRTERCLAHVMLHPERDRQRRRHLAAHLPQLTQVERPTAVRVIRRGPCTPVRLNRRICQHPVKLGRGEPALGLRIERLNAHCAARRDTHARARRLGAPAHAE